MVYSLNPRLSICITTYNVAPFLRQCLDSALQQDCNFPFEMVISDDASTDETPAIIREYSALYPQVIKSNFNPVNLRYARNYLKALSMCHSEYIAVLDGDDYWLDRKKLQRQVDYLDKHAEFTVSCHNGFVEDERGNRSVFIESSKPEVLELEQLLKDARNWNSSFVYRNVFQGQFPSWLEEAIHPDYPLHILHAAKGKIHYLNEPMGVYRSHNDNISKLWQGEQAARYSVNAIQIAMKLMREIPGKYRPALNLIAARHYDLVAGYHRKKFQWGKFLMNLLRGYFLCPVRSIKEYKDSYHHLFHQP